MKWTESEIKTLKQFKKDGLSVADIAQYFGRSWTAVNCKINRLRQEEEDEKTLQQQAETHAAECQVGSSAEEVLRAARASTYNEIADDASAYWKKRAKSAEKALADAQIDKTAADIVAENILDMAPVSYEAAAPLISQSDPNVKHGAPQSAVLQFSDTHIGAFVSPDQTLGLGQYSFEIFLRRLARLERSVKSIVEDHTTTQVPEIVIPMLGDMLDGALVHAAECGQANTMVEQLHSGGHAIAQFFRNLSTIAPLRIYGVVGNHTRWGTQHKMPTKNRNSNWDMVLYLYIQALTRDIPTIAWNLDWQPFATFEVQGFPFYAAHGDNIRGGDKTLGIPNHALGRMVSTTTQLFARKGITTPAYYLLGHLHRPIELPHARGQVIVNGAFPGIDGFALSEYFNSSYPIQKFWLMHPKFGRSATYDLRLDLGDDTPHNYNLPTQFTCK